MAVSVSTRPVDRRYTPSNSVINSRNRSKASSPANNSPIILIVDDDPAIRYQIRDILEPFGFRTLFAGNGDEAISLARSLLPDAMTLDLAMPVRNGQQTLSSLAADPILRQIPVVVVSGDSGKLDRTDQVVRVIDKPFELAELTAAVRFAVGKGASPRASVLPRSPAPKR